MDIQISQIFTQILGFLLMLWIMKRFAWKPFLEVLEKRRSHIQSELQSIESKQQELAKLLDEQKKRERELDEQARKTVEEATKKGNLRAKKIEEEAQAKAEHLVKRAEELMAFEKEKLQTEMREQMIAIGTLIAETMIKEKMSLELQEKAVQEVLERVTL